MNHTLTIVSFYHRFSSHFIVLCFRYELFHLSKNGKNIGKNWRGFEEYVWTVFFAKDEGMLLRLFLGGS